MLTIRRDTLPTGSLLTPHPGQQIWCNRGGNPAMAAPGMGDVLTGSIAALIAQGMAIEHAGWKPALHACLSEWTIQVNPTGR